jgi:hypothetical protein
MFSAGVSAGMPTARMPASARMAAEMTSSAGVTVAETLPATGVLWRVPAAKMEAAGMRLLAGRLRKTVTLKASRRPLPEVSALKARAWAVISPHRIAVACSRSAAVITRAGPVIGSGPIA